MWIVLFVSFYVVTGIVYGFQHMISIYTMIRQAGDKEAFLREMVAMYELTPQGAEYYAQLQDLYVEKGELLAEYKIYKANEGKYQFLTFLFGFVLWPYYIFSISKRKRTTKKREMGR
ncbi:TPA: hypothetical protein QCR36_003942 [Bacillus cereus]|uniref:hypothetical protein n=1 Tax=Bacillus sp. SRB3LM TaxID=2608689 RepID=UPI0018C44597|nr:hypothetical protein [Bacillus sp. SRB3LM]HDR4736891.1 hypothetical protein [Bacillus cereus]MBG0967542.1 hypothetical protein [Bacillus sp. SRB3LM]HDR4742411.1 hypothetical protein [Bacillus cereus]HDR4747998.1 hypothetical protein [Bacillus cereus]HDR4753472.1 hypothetical protein [Bacillus cereus]